MWKMRRLLLFMYLIILIGVSTYFTVDHLSPHYPYPITNAQKTNRFYFNIERW